MTLEELLKDAPQIVLLFMAFKIIDRLVEFVLAQAKSKLTPTVDPGTTPVDRRATDDREALRAMVQQAVTDGLLPVRERLRSLAEDVSRVLKVIDGNGQPGLVSQFAVLMTKMEQFERDSKGGGGRRLID